ncbi:MAG: hypothetical protein K6G54_06515 [Oscillospiraceae bacterium]|nr:hypothetical protein [Oscillospiraceae bacterium]
MPSRTSFFNRTVFWSDCRRYWPLTAAYTLLWLLVLPLEQLTEYGHSFTEPSAWAMLETMLDVTGIGGGISAFCTGILFAMAVFSYLTNPRAANGLHALSARRETLFCSHYLAGLACQLVPQLVCVLLSAAVLGAHGALDLRILGLAFLALALPTLFFYSFGVFCMLFTGQLLAAPVFYGVLNVIVVAVETMVRAFAGNYLYGWAEPETPTLIAFSPIVKLLETGVRGVTGAYGSSVPSDAQDVAALRLQGLGWLWVYAAAGLVFAVLSLLVCRVRPNENSGTTVAIGWARPVFRYGVAFCAALALGQLVYYLFFGQFRTYGSYSLPGSLACMAAAGMIGYFAAEMLLRKSLRVWRTGWRGALAVTGTLVALGVVLSLDLTGYEGYVPDTDRVESVSVDLSVYSNRSSCLLTSEDPDTIRLVTEAHRAVARDKARQLRLGAGDTPRDWGENGTVGCYFRVTYQLKNGGFVRRWYSDVTLFENELGDGDSPAAAFTALYNDPDVMLMRTLGHRLYSEEIDPRRLADLSFTGGYFNQSLWDGDTYLGEESRGLTPEQAQRIYDAAVRDVEAGRVRESLFTQDSRSVTLQLYANYLDLQDYGNAAAPSYDVDERASVEFDVVLTPNMRETLSALRAMGIEASFSG